MTLRISGYAILIAVATVVALFSTASIMQFTNPATASSVVLGSLYASIFLSVTGLFTLAGLLIRYYVGKGRFQTSLMVSFRQGLLIAILVIASLALQADKLLYWWVELSLVLFLLVIEILFNL